MLVSRTAEAKEVLFLDNSEGLWDVLILPTLPGILKDPGIRLDFNHKQAISCFLVANLLRARFVQFRPI